MSRHLVEGFVDGLFEPLVAAEDDVAFLHVGRPDVLHVEVAVVGRIALGVPGVVGAADGAVDHLDGVFEHAADHELGAAERAAAFGQRAGNGLGVGDGKEVARIFAVHLQIDVLLAFRNVLVAFQKYHGHGRVSFDYARAIVRCVCPLPGKRKLLDTFIAGSVPSFVKRAEIPATERISGSARPDFAEKPRKIGVPNGTI